MDNKSGAPIYISVTVAVAFFPGKLVCITVTILVTAKDSRNLICNDCSWDGTQDRNDSRVSNCIDELPIFLLRVGSFLLSVGLCCLLQIGFVFLTYG